MAELSSYSKNMLLLQQFERILLELQEVKKENKELKKENKELKEENKEVKKENKEVKKENKEVKKENKEVKEENHALTDRIVALEEIESKAPVIEYISEDQFKKVNLTHSKIQKCEIRDRKGDLISENLTYKGICRYIWDSMDKIEIIKHTTFYYKKLIKQKEEIGNGYKWCEEAGLYIQDKNAKGTMLEILDMVKVQRYTIEISIQLKDSDKNDIKKIYFKNFL